MHDSVEVPFAAAAVVDVAEAFDTDGRLPTSVTALQKSSSMRVPFVKAWNSQSLCFLQRRMISHLRISGSPPVSR